MVGLLMAILLVMFIVYRMRKKDEGSYALEVRRQTHGTDGIHTFLVFCLVLGREIERDEEIETNASQKR